MLVSICVLVNRLESRKPEMEIRESVEGVNVYNEESKLVDLLQFIYRTNKHYILTYIIQSFGTEIDIFEYYRKNLEKIGWEFTGEADNIDHSNNRKIGESFNFRKGSIDWEYILVLGICIITKKVMGKIRLGIL